MSSWYFEGNFGNGGSSRKLFLEHFPQVLGRDQSLDSPILYPSVSRRHAQIDSVETGLLLTDLNSSNGTFVNHQRIATPTQVRHGDIIHFGDLQLRVLDQKEELEEAGPQTVFIDPNTLGANFLDSTHELQRLIATGAITSVYQPIVSAPDAAPLGFEALGRGCSDKISNAPHQLFTFAESVGLEVPLSDLMRNRGVDLAAQHKLQGEIWINTHPSEMKDLDKLFTSLRKLRQRHPTLPLVFEVHEQCMVNSTVLKDVKQELHKLSIRFAFDDFGVGQARLTELVEVRPDIIKFDRVLISGIDKADSARVSVLQHLRQMVSDIGITTLAECVESLEEYQVLKEIGFELFQGYYFDKPQAPEVYSPC